MEKELIIGLLNPVMSFLFAMTFFVFWSKQKSRTYILGMSAAFLASGTGRVFAHFVYETTSIESLFISNGCYVLGVSLIFWALYKRAGLNAPLKLLVGVGIVGTLTAGYVAMNTPILNMRILIENSLMGTMFAIGAWHLRDSARRDGIEAFLFWVITLIAIQFIVTPQITLRIDGPITNETYADSIHRFVVGFSTAISLLILALSLIGTCVSDLITDVKRISMRDHLTGLKNRAVFEEEAGKQIAQLRRTPLPYSLLVIDIDNFKKINDEFGHPAGDAVIKAFGEAISDSVRDSDLAGRVGGEEFCVVLWNADGKGARIFAEGLRTYFSSLVIPALPVGRFVTASIGIATIEKNENYLSLYTRADNALYRAKRQGRNMVTLDEETGATDVDERASGNVVPDRKSQSVA